MCTYIYIYGNTYVYIYVRIDVHIYTICIYRYVHIDVGYMDLPREPTPQ